MINDNVIVQVHNITGQTVVYKIDEDNIRRKFAGYEIKKVPASELRKLFYIPGGGELLREYLCVENKELAAEFGVPQDQIEYFWTQEDVDRVLTTGSIEELEDALEFGPLGIVDMIQDRAVALKINDLMKRETIFKHTGANINNMIANSEDEEETPAPAPAETVRRRRVSHTE